MKTEGAGANGTNDIVSWVSVCPSGPLKVAMRRTRMTSVGDQSPRMGSICRVRVWPKTEDRAGTQDVTGAEEHGKVTEVHSEMQDFSYPRSQGSVLQVPEGTWVRVHVGDGQCDVVERCLEGMKAGEQCELLVTALKSVTKLDSGLTQQADCRVPDPGAVEKQSGEARDPLCYVVELNSFTPGRESWEMTPEEKWTWVKSHKRLGGERFHNGDIWGAAERYSRALKLLLTLTARAMEEKKGVAEVGEGREDRLKAGESEAEREKPHPQGSGGMSNSVTHSKSGVPERTWKSEQQNVAIEDEYKAVRSELHANLSLCQLRLGQPARAQQSSSKAIELDPSNVKAWYRLGQASLQVRELALAQRAFKKVLELQPGSPSAQKALREVKIRQRELDCKLGQKLSRMFS